MLGVLLPPEGAKSVVSADSNPESQTTVLWKKTQLLEYLYNTSMAGKKQKKLKATRSFSLTTVKRKVGKFVSYM